MEWRLMYIDNLSNNCKTLDKTLACQCACFIYTDKILTLYWTLSFSYRAYQQSKKGLQQVICFEKLGLLLVRNVYQYVYESDISHIFFNNFKAVYKIEIFEHKETDMRKVK